MSELRIITNNVPRDVIYAHELTPAEREQFDHHDWAKIDAGEDSAEFFRYRGELHDLGNFMRRGIAGWDGTAADSFFSGLAVRYVEDGERVIVALYLA